jgi:hypothetical protein
MMHAGLQYDSGHDQVWTMKGVAASSWQQQGEGGREDGDRARIGPSTEGSEVVGFFYGRWFSLMYDTVF